MRAIALTIISLLALGTAIIAAQTAPSQPQVPPSAQSSPTTDSQQTTPPASSSSSAQSQSNTGTSANAPSGQAHQPGDWVAQQLNLSQEQQDKLRPILADEIQQMRAVRDDASLSEDQKRDKMNQIRQNAGPKIQAVLTPEQRQKLAQLQEQARQQREQQNGTTQQNPQQKPPQ
jgi:hypothetical protein